MSSKLAHMQHDVCPGTVEVAHVDHESLVVEVVTGSLMVSFEIEHATRDFLIASLLGYGSPHAMQAQVAMRTLRHAMQICIVAAGRSVRTTPALLVDVDPSATVVALNVAVGGFDQAHEHIGIPAVSHWSRVGASAAVSADKVEV